MPKVVDHNQRRREIIEAAARVGSLQGLSNLSLSNVGAAAGMSKGLVQHYFSSKEELLAVVAEYRDELTDRLMDEAVAALGEDATPIERLRAMMLALIPRTEEHRYIAVLGTAPFLLEIRDEQSQKALRERHLAYLGKIENAIRQGQEAGEITTRVPSSTLTRLATAIVVGIVARELSSFESEQEWTDDIDAWINSLQSHASSTADTTPYKTS